MWCTLCWTIKWWSDWNSMCFYWCYWCDAVHNRTLHSTQTKSHFDLSDTVISLTIIAVYSVLCCTIPCHAIVQVHVWVCLCLPICQCGVYIVHCILSMPEQLISKFIREENAIKHREHANIISQIDFLFSMALCVCGCACTCTLAKAFSALFSIATRATDMNADTDTDTAL